MIRYIGVGISCFVVMHSAHAPQYMSWLTVVVGMFLLRIVELLERVAATPKLNEMEKK